MRFTFNRMAPIGISLLLSAAGANAQSSPSPYPLFSDDALLEFRMSAPFGQVFRDDEDRPEYVAVIEWTEPDGRRLAREIEVRIRGNSRIEFCQYPPLSLDFPKDDVAGTIFEGQDRLKLVVLCGSSRYYEEYLAQEYLIYRMFNVLTDRSFRVHWATVEYVDNGRRRPRARSAPAFLIESDSEAAERLGMELVEPETLSIESLDVAHSALLMVFGYLIGNTDWALVRGPEGEPCCHNGKVLREPGGRHIILPYDFDNSGLIDAKYAVPNETLPIRSVTRRLYRGYCEFNPALDAAIAAVNRQRERLLAVFDSGVIGERGRERAFAYLNRSFERIGDPDELQEEIHGRCRDDDD